MKTRTLALFTGLGGSLLLGQHVRADVTSISWEERPNPYGLTTFHIYADFDNPNDVMVAVAGTPNNPLRIEVIGGTFYQHVLGSDLAPNPVNVAAFPSLAYDSYVTIGKTTSVGDQTMLTPGWPGFGVSVLPSDPADQENIAWFITPDLPQGIAGLDGRVLLGVFSTGDGIGIEGTFLIQAETAGGTIQQTLLEFNTTMPAPGAWLALGAAGLPARRRRR